MKIMFVDDEKLVLEDLISIIDWNMFGFDDVFIADNTESAMMIMDQYHPDIILCDIEMPGAGGIALLEWCKTRYPDTEVIMLTSHASFEYAQSAIHLGCFDYILKPVTVPVLSETLSKAMAKNRETHAVNILRQKEFLQNIKHQELSQIFWESLLSEQLSGNETEWISTAQDIGIHINTEINYMLILIQYHDNQQMAESVDSLIDDTTLHDFFSERAAGFCRLPLDKNMVLYVMWDIKNLDCVNELKWNTSVTPFALYFEIGKSLSDLIRIKKRLLQIASENLFLKTGMYGRDFYIPQKQSQLDLPDIAKWDNYVNSSDIQKIENELNQWFFNPVTRNGLTRSMLSQLQNDFEQWVYHVLQSREIQANKILYSNEALKSRFEALYSVYSMQKWIHVLLSQVREIIANLSKDNNIVNQVKTYVREHMKEEITRVHIAESLFLNADYLDRVFKRETGESVNKYLLRKKIDLAKSLLAQDTYQISDVAMECGYTNQSSFTVMFKRETGLTPYEFKKLKNQ